MSEPKSAHCHARLQYSEQGIPFVLATKTYPRRLVYRSCSENNSRSSPKRAEYVYYQDRKIWLETK